MSSASERRIWFLVNVEFAFPVWLQPHQWVGLAGFEPAIACKIVSGGRERSLRVESNHLGRAYETRLLAKDRQRLRRRELHARPPGHEPGELLLLHSAITGGCCVVAA